MILDQVEQILIRMADIYSAQIPIMIALALFFTLLAIFESQASCPGKPWWRNPGLPTDICYALIHSVLGPYFRIPAFVVLYLLVSGSYSQISIEEYFKSGRGLFSGLPFLWQSAIYLLLSDFLLYWIHRFFHFSSFWRYHAIHHSAEQVDWSTSYRFHPVNLMLQQSLVSVLMIFLGISPQVMAFFLPWDILSAAFVHANVKWTFGPLKYVIATPVFHRWHHGPPEEGGNSNFASTFAIYDVIFGTFYMPEGQQPRNFGIDDNAFPKSYLGQLVHPFKALVMTQAAANAPQPASAAPEGNSAG